MTARDVEVTVDDGTRLHARVHEGSGRAIVLLHDLDCSAGYWDAVVQRLRERQPNLPVVALDLRGHGSSTCGKETSRKRLVKDVKRLCAALGLDEPVLAGHGWGADIALAADFADSVVAINPLLGRPAADFDDEVPRPRGLPGAVDAAALEACAIGASSAKRLRRSRRDAPLLLVVADPLDTDAPELADLEDAAVEVFRWQSASRHLPLEAPQGVAALLWSWIEEMA